MTDREQQIVRRAERGQLGDHAPGNGPSHRRGADQADHRVGPQVQQHRLPGHVAVVGHHPVGRRLEGRVPLVERVVTSAEGQRSGQWHGAQPDAHGREVRVLQTALPDPGAFADDRPEPDGIGVAEPRRVLLVPSRLHRPLGHPLQVAEVAHALVPGPVPAGGELLKDHGHAQGHRRQGHGHADGDVGGVGVVDDEVGAAQHGDQREQELGPPREAHAALLVRRRRHRHLVRRHGRRQHPRRAMQDGLAHRLRQPWSGPTRPTCAGARSRSPRSSRRRRPAPGGGCTGPG